jgi:hypothetical protein
MPAYRRLILALIALAAVNVARAAEPEWLKLQAPSFGVISQLDEDDTRRWAVEFDQFIGAMHALYNIAELDLPPLTIVLFRQNRQFAPYHVQTESGQVKIAGFFGRTKDWSVIGLSGGGRDSATRAVVYHEAVHWFMTANPTELPLWFSEGFAEALSTFRVVDGKGRWGEAIDGHVQFLGFYGLSPLGDLLRASQDEALHGRASSRYYPQSWAFVHYLMFGNGGTQRAKLASFIKQQLETDLDTAFSASFGTTHEEFTSELRRYLSNGRYGYAEVELRDRGDEMTVEPASEASVEFALGRLAAVGGNLDLARGHGERVVTLAPGAAAGYEILAHAARRGGDDAALTAALDRAIELGSRDPWVYTTKADSLMRAHWRDHSFFDDVLSSDIARSAADLYMRALGLRPRNDDAYAGLVTAVLNVDEIGEDLELVINAGRIFFPNDGLLLVGQAAVAKGRGDYPEATRLLRAASVEPITLPNGYRDFVAALEGKWVGEWVEAELGTLLQDARFADARAFIDERLADAGGSGRLRTYLEGVANDLPALERLHAALAASAAGRRAEAVETLRAVVGDSGTSERIRRRAEQLLERIAP